MPKPSSTSQANPIAKCFALTVLVALAALILLRHLFGSVTINAGTR
jgi:hypothetical protein